MTQRAADGTLGYNSSNADHPPWMARVRRALESAIVQRRTEPILAAETAAAFP